VERLKIIWSDVAVNTLDRILMFYADRNGSDIYSKKLYQKILKDIRLLSRVPLLGISASIKNVRGLIIDDFIVYYEIKGKYILILTIWDCSKNPNENKYVG
jgi:plasmid stabilization system protein ParE